MVSLHPEIDRILPLVQNWIIAEGFWRMIEHFIVLIVLTKLIKQALKI
jgi:hypothetical protein